MLCRLELGATPRPSGPIPPSARSPPASSPLSIPVYRSLWLATVFANIGSCMEDVTAGWLMHLTPYDGLVIDDKFQPRVADAPAIKTTEVYKEFIETGPTGGAAFDFGQMQNAFLQGQAAMYCDSISIFGPAADPAKSKVKDTVGYALHPKAVKYSGELGGFGMAIPNNSACA